MLFHSFLELSLSTNSVLREKEKEKNITFASAPWKLKKAVGKHDGNSGLGFSNKRRKKNAPFLFICKQTMVRKHYYYYESVLFLSELRWQFLSAFPRRKVLLILNYMVGSLYFYYYYLVSKRKCLRIYY
ncbi:hypothetical protein ERO13_D07G041850v2 [Gossypium hirsutum]|uniref:Uncharacterized protein n=2 Tax=Gossypium TaxID=3633 RepID=A0A0D2PI90_GOSRA|nr:hypothetical protein ERO13_D07G041850v2 [Gossypium hirsutum]KJB06494.1 hypothetical protein B456_001G044500 [Gossypium raimondii]TYG60161.1 hypothetical protein ES288_D07G046300v1 [Gossypium darwinii]